MAVAFAVGAVIWPVAAADAASRSATGEGLVPARGEADDATGVAAAAVAGSAPDARTRAPLGIGTAATGAARSPFSARRWAAAPASATGAAGAVATATGFGEDAPSERSPRAIADPELLLAASRRATSGFVARAAAFAGAASANAAEGAASAGSPDFANVDAGRGAAEPTFDDSAAVDERATATSAAVAPSTGITADCKFARGASAAARSASPRLDAA